MAASSYSVVDLRQRPEFAPSVADRVWRAWWKPKGHALAFIEGLVRQSLGSDPIPSALVAHDGATFLGTASVIASDLDVRPLYTPWVATVGPVANFFQPTCELHENAAQSNFWLWFRARRRSEPYL